MEDTFESGRPIIADGIIKHIILSVLSREELVGRYNGRILGPFFEAQVLLYESSKFIKMSQIRVVLI